MLAPSTMGEHVDLADWMRGEILACYRKMGEASNRFVNDIIESLEEKEREGARESVAKYIKQQNRYLAHVSSFQST